MNLRRWLASARCAGIVGGWVIAALASRALSADAELAAPGFRPTPPGVHALVGARVFTKAGQSFDRATVVIRDGLISAVGPDVQPPPDARVWDLSGRTVYPGFIEPYLTWAFPTSAGSGGGRPGSRREVGVDGDAANAERRDFRSSGDRFFGVSGQEEDPGAAGPGHAIRGVAPERRVSGAYVPDSKVVESLRELGFTAANVVPASGIFRGNSALVTLGNANPNDSILRADTAQHIGLEAAGGNEYPASLMGVVAVVRQTLLDAQHAVLDRLDYEQRAGQRPRPSYHPSLAALEPVVQSKARQRVVWEPGSILMVNRAAALSREFSLSYQIVATGQEWRRPDLAKAAGASFIVPIPFPAVPKFPESENWEDVDLDTLRAWDWAPENPAVLRQQGIEIALTTHGAGDRAEFRKNLKRALERGLSETDALAALTSVPARLCGVGGQLGSIEPGKIANLTVTDARGYFVPEARVEMTWVDGRVYETPEFRESSASKDKDKDKEKEKEKKPSDKDDAAQVDRVRVAQSPLKFRGPVTNPPVVVIEGATVWTSGPMGVLTNGTVVLEGGRIRAVVPGALAAADRPNVALVLNGAGKHITPGIIDCHNHSMILGGVNEGTLPSTAQVRIGDVVNADTVTIRQQLAGGVTVVNLLHGSANPIGGQNCVIKLRDGLGPEDLKFQNAPSGIKFALGENVKQANWGERFTSRFPQTRMGVGVFFQNRFTAAQQYREQWTRYRANGGRPPRTDLELEALAEILGGSRLIHCHSYRQDEILHFLRVMESFQVRVATLQHGLEGYKVADEVAAHGAGASLFADWWGYKFEVIDAIPHAASLMRERGVVVSINSDSSDHARRLNLEAAKGIKYGGMPEADALQMVTLNPAKQLGVEHWVGSLEVGKDADVVVWSGSPLSTLSVVEQTWVDGRLYFDRAQEATRSQGLKAEREALIAKARKISGTKENATASESARKQFFARALEQASEWRHANQCEDCRNLPR